MNTDGTPTAVGEVSNDAAELIDLEQPYQVRVTVEGTSAILFHRWSNEAVAEKARAAKGSKAKKSDNVESYVYRMLDGTIAIPGRYLIGSITDPRNGAAKYQADPRSPRKSALDLYRAGVMALTELAAIKSAADPHTPAKTWDYLDSQRVMVQRAAVTRVRPAFLAGWRAVFDLQVVAPNYIRPTDLLAMLSAAGRFVGVADFRPTYGRFAIVSFDVGFDD